MENEARMQPFVPVLFVRDVPASAEFFRDTLGFDIDFLHGTPPFYGSVSRDDACLHLRYVPKPNFAELAAADYSLILGSIEVSDIKHSSANSPAAVHPFASLRPRSPGVERICISAIQTATSFRSSTTGKTLSHASLSR